MATHVHGTYTITPAFRDGGYVAVIRDVAGELLSEDGLELVEFQDCHEACPDTWDEDGVLVNPECPL